MTSPLETLLNELETARKNATPSPWKLLYKGDATFVGNCEDPHPQKEILVCDGEIVIQTERYDDCYSEDTARFIASAANNILKLIEIIRVQKKFIESLDFDCVTHEDLPVNFCDEAQLCIKKVEQLAGGQNE